MNTIWACVADGVGSICYVQSLASQQPSCSPPIASPLAAELCLLLCRSHLRQQRQAPGSKVSFFLYDCNAERWPSEGSLVITGYCTFTFHVHASFQHHPAELKSFPWIPSFGQSSFHVVLLVCHGFIVGFDEELLDVMSCRQACHSVSRSSTVLETLLPLQAHTK